MGFIIISLLFIPTTTALTEMSDEIILSEYPSIVAKLGIGISVHKVTWSDGSITTEFKKGMSLGTITGGASGCAEFTSSDETLMARYDYDKNGRISKQEASAATADYFNGLITKSDAVKMVAAYLSECSTSQSQNAPILAVPTPVPTPIPTPIIPGQTATPTPVPTPRINYIKIISNPTGAKVTEKSTGNFIGTTPIDSYPMSAGTSKDIVISLSGYNSQTLMISGDTLQLYVPLVQITTSSGGSYPQSTTTPTSGTQIQKPLVQPPTLRNYIINIITEIKSWFGLATITGGVTATVPINQVYKAPTILSYTAPDTDYSDGSYTAKFGTWYITDINNNILTESGMGNELTGTEYKVEPSFTFTAPGKYYLVAFIIKQVYTYTNGVWSYTENKEAQDIQQITATVTNTGQTTTPISTPTVQATDTGQTTIPISTSTIQKTAIENYDGEIVPPYREPNNISPLIILSIMVIIIGIVVLKKKK